MRYYVTPTRMASIKKIDNKSIDEGGVVEEWVKKVKRNKRYKVPVIKYVSHGDVMYSIWKIVNNIILTLYGTDSWSLDLLW